MVTQKERKKENVRQKDLVRRTKEDTEWKEIGLEEKEQ